MPGKRTYGDGCAVAHGLELIGERWALLVVRELLFGPKRFTDLRSGLPGVSADVLTQRLGELQDAGVVRRRRLPAPAASWIYELTEWGTELEPLVTGLARWSSRSPAMPHDLPISVDSLVLSLKVLFDARTARDLDLCVALLLDEDHFRVRITDGTVDVARAEPDSPDLVISTSPGVFGMLLRKERELADAIDSGEAALTGARAKAQRFLAVFPFPSAPS